MKLGLLGVLGFMGAFIACDGEHLSPNTVERDSLGVTIVESIAPQWSGPEFWSVDTAPVVDLAVSGTEAAHEFHRVQDATVLADGAIAVADGGSREVRFFSASGEFLATMGGEGEGPGEFMSLHKIDAFRGDSLLVFDNWLGRATVLNPRWDYARVITPYTNPTRVNGLLPLDDGTLVGSIYSLDGFGETEGLVQLPFRIITLSPAGDVIDSIAVLRGFETFVFSRGDMRPLFSKTGHMSTHGHRIYLGSADSLQFDVYSSTGQLQRIVRVPGYDLRITPDEMRDERASRTRPDSPSWLKAAVARLPNPEYRPAYSALLVDTESCVWAPEFHAATELEDPTDWQVFSPSGEWLGSVRTPARFTVFEIGEDYVLGVGRDDMDVEHVQVLRLDRT
jgi:hypothetical protein